MPSIIVSDDVLEMIGALKKARESTEDETLRRVLGRSLDDRKKRLQAYEATEQDTHSTN
jgi:hypothetical protein